jgi:hypothetical protein
MVRLAAVLLALLFPAGATAQDTLVVRADNPPVWGRSPRLVEELRIGTRGSDGPSDFGYVSTVLELPDGSIWVADRQRSVVRRYSSKGEHQGDVGRRGQGPGEFDYIAEMRLLPGGRVAVLDSFNRRIHLFGSDGRFLSALPSPAGVAGGQEAMEVDTAGRLYLRNVERSPRDRRVPVAATDGFRLVGAQPAAYWIVMSPTGAIVDTIARPPSLPDSASGYLVSTRSVISALGYRVEGRNAEYALHRPLRDGRVVRIERTWTPVPFEREEREELLAAAGHRAAQLDRLTRGGGDVAPVPLMKPSWSSFVTDAEGRIWVRRIVRASKVGETPGQRAMREQFGNPPVTWGQPAVFDVIEPSGRFLGSVTVPDSESSDDRSSAPRVRLGFARGMTLWTIERGRQDEQHVVRYRIVPGS